jgi:hypothetical protein
MTLIEELKAMEDIRQTKCRYLRFTDAKDWKNLDAVFCRKVRFGGDEMYEGADVVVELIRKGTEGVRTVHHGHNSEVWIDSPDEARAITAFEDLGFNPAGELVMHGYGRYQEVYRREDGGWRIWECKIDRLTVVDKGPVRFNAPEAPAPVA